MKRFSEARFERRHPTKMSNKGLAGKTMAVIGLVIAVLIFGALGTGAGSFWYNVNNPNSSCLNSQTGIDKSANITCGGAVTAIQGTIIPLIIAVSAIFLFVPRKKA